MKIDSSIPGNWELHVDEISAGVFRAVAVANDGRKIEVSGSDSDYVMDSIRSSFEILSCEPSGTLSKQAGR